MTDHYNQTRTSRQNSATGWAIGAIFVIAIVVAIFFYNGRDVGQQTTTTNPSNAPNVMTGSNGSNASRK